MSIVPDATVLVTFVLVWILVIVLSRVFFKPVGRILDERASGLDKDKSAAAQAMDAYGQDLRRIEAELKEARLAATQVRDQAEAEALKEKARLLQDVQAECRAQVEKAKRDIAEEVARLKKTLESTTGQMAEEIERRILN